MCLLPLPNVASVAIYSYSKSPGCGPDAWSRGRRLIFLYYHLSKPGDPFPPADQLPRMSRSHFPPPPLSYHSGYGAVGSQPAVPIQSPPVVLSPDSTHSLYASPDSAHHSYYLAKSEPDDRASTGSTAAAGPSSEPLKKRQKRNKPTLSCHECVERKTKVGFFLLSRHDLSFLLSPALYPAFPFHVIILYILPWPSASSSAIQTRPCRITQRLLCPRHRNATSISMYRRCVMAQAGDCVTTLTKHASPSFIICNPMSNP
ncbi:hypothetical protein GGS20DRAFT_416396 [Poronia punctata]|nr:hypothetical protein GGS20DRAFT_416396 [Poronia punctata]